MVENIQRNRCNKEASSLNLFANFNIKKFILTNADLLET